LINVIPSIDGLNFESLVAGRYSEDPLFRKVVENPTHFKNFEFDAVSKLLYLKKDDTKVLCIPRVLINRRSEQEIVISEAHSILAHLGASKTLDYLRQHVWWK
ncbi:hypothetical protein BDZ89DRAFT_882411, partial [Hymenopellis radicata]